MGKLHKIRRIVLKNPEWYKGRGLTYYKHTKSAHPSYCSNGYRKFIEKVLKDANIAQ